MLELERNLTSTKVGVADEWPNPFQVVQRSTLYGPAARALEALRYGQREEARAIVHEHLDHVINGVVCEDNPLCAICHVGRSPQPWSPCGHEVCPDCNSPSGCVVCAPELVQQEEETGTMKASEVSNFYQDQETGESYTVMNNRGSWAITGYQGPKPADGSTPPHITILTDPEGVATPVWPTQHDAAGIARITQMISEGRLR